MRIKQFNPDLNKIEHNSEIEFFGSIKGDFLTKQSNIKFRGLEKKQVSELKYKIPVKKFSFNENTLKIKNIPGDYKNNDLNNFILKKCKILPIHCNVVMKNNRSMRYAYINFKNEKDLDAVYKVIDGLTIDRYIIVAEKVKN